MFENLKVDEEVFDSVINARRSVKSFDSIEVSDQEINKIINAGTKAPFASIPTAGKDDFRKFMIITRSNPQYDIIVSIIDLEIKKYAKKINSSQENTNHIYYQMINKASELGFNKIIGNCKQFIFVAEKRGIPNNANYSIAFCVQTMWLKAVSLKIGVRLIDIISQIEMDKNIDFLQLLDLTDGDYAINCLGIGYPEINYQPNNVTYPNIEKVIKKI